MRQLRCAAAAEARGLLRLLLVRVGAVSADPAVARLLQSGSMRLISFRYTSLLKRGIWLSAAALLVTVSAPAVIGGSLRQNPAAALLPAAILIALCVYFSRITQIHRLADEVTDCGDHLKARRGRTDQVVPFAHVSTADVVTGGGLHRIRLHLLAPSRFGAHIEFLPHASLWSNLGAVQRVAAILNERASQAKFAGSVP